MPPTTWTPADVMKLMAVGTCCLCIMIVVGVVMIGVYAGKISPEALGSVGKAGMGTGIVCMLGLLIYGVKGMAK